MQTGQVQATSSLIQKELDTKCIIIYGKPRNGKTILATVIAYQSYHKRIYANFNIYKKGISVNKRYNSFKEVYNIRYSPVHGVICLDETGINANSKDSFSDTNRMLAEVLFLSGKKNCDMILIAQSYESIDINFRRNAGAIFFCEKVKRKGKKPLFKISKVIPDGQYMRVVNSFILDTLELMDILGISYDTLEESRMDEKIEKKALKEAKKQKQIEKLHEREES